MSIADEIAGHIRTIPDFPIPGIQFRDVTTLFAHPEGFRKAVDVMIERIGDEPLDAIAAMDARGFVLGGAMAYRMGLGLVPIRKKGKLPGSTLVEAYSLEYGDAIVEIHDDALVPGAKVLLVDDLLATGGTASAGIKLLERLGAEVVAAIFLVDLPALGGAKRLSDMGVRVETICTFDGE